VHHKDENKFNNDPSNLEALSGQAAHLKKHDYWRGRRRSQAQTATAGSGNYDPSFGW
jgi:hypothetical protein